MTTSTSVPPRANLNDIIEDLFENEIIKSDGLIEHFTFSDVNLTKEQQNLLVYPPGFVPMHIYILQQYDANTGINFTTDLSIASFVKNGDGYIYGYYFDITDQSRFDIEDLTESKHAVTLDPSAKFTADTYLEVYNNVLGKTMILGLKRNNPPYATLQYAHSGRYYYELLRSNGIDNPQYPPTKLIGLSKNLLKYTKCRMNS